MHSLASISHVPLLDMRDRRSYENFDRRIRNQYFNACCRMQCAGGVSTGAADDWYVIAGKEFADEGNL